MKDNCQTAIDACNTFIHGTVIEGTKSVTYAGRAQCLERAFQYSCPPPSSRDFGTGVILGVLIASLVTILITVIL